MSKTVDLGQVFTHEIIAKYMVQLFTLPSYAKILDPCFGKGVFLKYLIEGGKYQIDGVELDEYLFNYVASNESFASCRLYNTNFLLFQSSEQYDGIIMNPPYIRQEKINDLYVFGITKDIIRQDSLFTKLPRTANMYMYFVVKALSLLKENGELIIIFPHTWMKSRSGNSFTEILKNECFIDQEIYIKGNAFGNNVLVDVVILKIIKNKHKRECKQKYLVYDGKTLKEVKKVYYSFNATKHVALSEYASIRRGLTTGFNKFYIGNFANKEGFNKYTKKILSTPKDVIGYTTDNASLKDLLVVNDEWVNINKYVKTYLEEWHSKILTTGLPKAFVERIKNYSNWYKIHTFNCKGILFGYIIRSNMKFILNMHDIIVRDNFYIIYPKIDIYLLFGLLNNYYTFLRLEELGKYYGAGLLKLQKYDLNSLLIINIKNMEEVDIETIKQFARKLAETGDEKFIYDITELIGKYEDIGYEDVIKRYTNTINSRLMQEV